MTVSTSKHFDPSDPGTPDHVWSDFFHGCPEWAPSAGPLVVVSPHPDDEIMAAGGLIHSWALRGGEVTVVSVTDGEAAYPQWKGLDLVRRAELKNALRKLSVTHVTVVRAGVPDGKVAEHVNRLRNVILSLAQPAMTLVGPYELDGHPDHEAAGRVCIDVARTQNVTLARYPVWTWHHSTPESLTGQRCRIFPLTQEARRSKARAMECFASQLHPPQETPIVPPHVLPYFQRPFEVFIV